MFRVGSTPQQLTCDVLEGATAADRTVAQIVQRIVTTRGGLVSGDLAAASFTALDTANSAEVGIDATGNIDAVLTELCDSIGAWFGFDANGILSVVRMEAPIGTPTRELTNIEIKNMKRIASNDPGKGVPAWQVTVNHTRNYTVQPGGQLAGYVGNDRRQFTKDEYRAAKATDTTVKTPHLLSPELSFNTLLTSAADAATEANRRLAMFSVRRDIYELSLPASLDPLSLGELISIRINRFGCTGGRLYRVIGIGNDFATGKHTATVWG
jgi:hypothetical protein